MQPVRRRTLWLAMALVSAACVASLAYTSPATTLVAVATSTTAPPPTTTTTVPATTTSTAPPTTTTSVASGIQERPLALPGSPVVLRFDDPLPPGVLATISDALPVARADLGDSGRLAVHVYASADIFVAAHDAPARALARADIDGGTIASSSTGTIWIYAPTFAERNVATRKMIVFHEYFHTVQAFLSSSRSARVPLWLREGSARYFEYRGGADHGLTDFAQRRATEVRLSRPMDPLQSFETRGGPSFRGETGEAYTMGFLATDYLVHVAGVDAVKHDFWAALRSGTDWHTVFADVFGTSVDQFYADFEAYRLTL